MAHRIVIESTTIRGERGQYYASTVLIIQETRNPEFEAACSKPALPATRPPHRCGRGAVPAERTGQSALLERGPQGLRGMRSTTVTIS
jgi:hypothetical protein